jgi:high affinity sulfate transporter 1
MSTTVAPPPPARARGLARFFPILAWLPAYQRAWLRPDIIAGLTVVALLIPEGMAYAEIAGVPPQAAFYAAPFGLLAFAIFGSSRQLVVAVSAAIATMSFAIVSEVATPNTTEFIVMTAALALLAGIISLVAGALKLGRVAQFFSESVMVGFISGLALVIAIKQAPKLLGIHGAEGNFWQRLIELMRGVPETHLLTLAVGALCLALLIFLEHRFHKVPAALVALVFGIAVSAALGLEARGVEVVGDIPAGLAPPQWPALTLEQWGLLVAGGFGLALVCFAEAVGPARAFAAAHKYEIDPNQEFIGLGAANMAAGLFQGFPIGSSLSKSAANDRAGARTQLSGIVAAALTIVVALFFTRFFYALPEATLGAIVIVAVSGMVKVEKLKHLFRVRRADFVLALIALFAVLTFETLEALLIAVIASLFALVWRISQPRLAVLGRAPDRLEFGDVRRHPDYRTVPGLLIARPESGLFFANAGGFRDAVIAEIEASAEPVRAVLLDLGATVDLDVPAADMLAELAEELRGRGIRLMLTRVIAPVREILDRAGALEKIGPESIYGTQAEGVAHFLRAEGNTDGVRELANSLALQLRELERG